LSDKTKYEKAYIEYLNRKYDAPNYGDLLYKGDYNSFLSGLKEWLSLFTEEEKYNYGFIEKPEKINIKIIATKTLEVTLPAISFEEAKEEFLKREEKGLYDGLWKLSIDKVSTVIGLE
jgi:hypothetical protein